MFFFTEDYCYIYAISCVIFVALAFFHTIKHINHVHWPKQRIGAVFACKEYDGSTQIEFR